MATEQRIEVGDYARGIETGQIGLVVAISVIGDQLMAELHGVDFYAMTLFGQTLSEAVDSSDRWWNTPDDLKLVKKGEKHGDI